MDRSVITGLIYNAALLLALSLVYSLISDIKIKSEHINDILIGTTTALVGIGIMLSSIELAPGIVFDSRSILLSISGLFFGLIPTLIAAICAALFRIYIGGAGTLCGVIVILLTAGLGLLWRYFRFNIIIKEKKKALLELYVFGLLIHIAAIICFMIFINPVFPTVLQQVGIPFITIYPLGTVLLGMILLNHIERAQGLRQLEENENRYRSMFEDQHAVMLLIDPKNGDIIDANAAACDYYGWSLDELRKIRIYDITTLPQDLVDEEIKLSFEGKKNHFYFQHRLASGEIRDAESYSGPIVIDGQKLIFSIVIDNTEKKKAEMQLDKNLKYNESLLKVLKYDTDSVQNLLDYALKQAIDITISKVGYIYFYDSEKEEFTLNTWSEGVMRECSVLEKNTVYKLDETGIWGEAVRQKKPIVVNDFTSPNPLKKGYPEGHVKLDRFITVPIFDNNDIVAVIGLANKEADYTDMDVWYLTFLTKNVWDVVERKRSNEVIKKEREQLRITLLSIADGVITTDESGNIQIINDVAQAITGWSKQEAMGKHFSQVINIVDENTNEKCENPLQNVLITGKAKLFANHSCLISKSGAVCPISSSAAPIKGKDGKIIGLVMTFSDVTEKKNAERLIKDSEERFRTIFEQASVGIAITSLEGRFLRANRSCCDMLGYSFEELSKMNFVDITYPDDKEISKQAAEKLIMGIANNVVFEKRYIRKDKEVIWANVSASVSCDSNGQANCFITVIHDTTKRKLSEIAVKISENRLNRAQMISHVGNWELDIAKKQIWASDEAFKIFGIKKQGSAYISLKLINDMTRKEDRPKLDTALRRLLFRNKEYDIEYKITRIDDGEERIIHSNAIAEYDKDGRPSKVLGIIQDVTENRKKEEEIVYLSYYDVLTGLYNRAFFNAEIKRLDTVRQLPLSIIMGDVNGLKLINDGFGHSYGDKILVQTAAILKKCCRGEDIVARIGGDEFCILLPKTNNDIARDICRRIHLMCQEYKKETSQQMLYPSISLGCATKTAESTPLEGVIKDAEAFMYRSKLLESKSMYSSLISSIKITMFEKSHETEEHAERMTELSHEIGLHFKLTDEQLNELALLATLHDIGKMSIDDHVLNKPSKLDENEWKEMKKHPEVGYRIAMASPELVPIAGYILTHHECWNGGGYPQGLVGKEIPLLSRIISVVDSYDAMTNDRPYSKAMPKEDAIAEIIRKSGTQFDPDVVNVFVNVMNEKSSAV